MFGKVDKLILAKKCILPVLSNNFFSLIVNNFLEL